MDIGIWNLFGIWPLRFGDYLKMDNLLRAYASHRYAILFYTLLATLAAVPLLTALGRDAELLEIFLALSLLAGALGF